MTTDGTGKALAQDATLQLILLAFGGGPIPQGGTGMGLAQDATLQLLLAAIVGPVSPLTWTAVAAGGTAVISSSTPFAGAFDTTGAQCKAPLPAGATDGLVVILKAVGASNTNGILITPGAGESVEDPGNPGVVLAANTTVTFFGQGGCLTYKYQAAGTRWLLQANA
ncbi:MAG: hypothetical protein ACHREM_23995 [Polyangiales bacterium]